MRQWLTLSMLLMAGTAFAAPGPPHAPSPYVPLRHEHDALAGIVADHRLRCGAVTNEADFSNDSTHGNLADFARDLCAAASAAALGDWHAASLIGYPDDAQGLRALHDNKIDVLFGVTPDGGDAAAFGVDYAPTAFFDSQGFLANAAMGITKPADLAGKLLCSITGTPAEARALAWRDASGVRFADQAYTERGEMSAALEGGRCAAITDDVSELADMRSGFARPSREFPILPQRIAIDPWAPAVREGEVRLRTVIGDVLAALIVGEERGVTQANATAAAPGLPAWFGPTPGLATTLAMPNGWAARAIAVGGNYGEIYARDLGTRDRGPDALWSAGGLLAPPIIR